MGLLRRRRLSASSRNNSSKDDDNTNWWKWALTSASFVLCVGYVRNVIAATGDGGVGVINTSTPDLVLREFLMSGTNTSATAGMLSNRSKSEQQAVLSQQTQQFTAPADYIASFRRSFDDGDDSSDDARFQFKTPNGKPGPGDRKLGFLHIPKAGGTTVEDVASAAGVAWGSCAFPRTKPMAVHRCPPTFYGRNRTGTGNYGGKGIWLTSTDQWHVPRQYFPLATVDPYWGTEIFVVVRDVYGRMVSEFYHRCRQLGRAKMGCDPDRMFDAEHFNEWILLKFADPGKVEKRFRGHLVSQYAFVVGQNGVRYADHVLRLENLTDEFAALMGAYGLHPAIHLHEETKSNANRHDEEVKVGVGEMERETLRAVNDAYRDDFRAFGYDMKEK